MRQLDNPSAGDTIVGTLEGSAGGTGAITAPAALIAIAAVPANQIGQSQGVAGLDSSARMYATNIPDDMFDTVNISGPTSVVRNSASTYVIENFDSFTTYTVSSGSGYITRIEDVVTFVAPNAVGDATFTINERTFTVSVLAAPLVTPVITSPVAASTIIVDNYTFTGSAFAATGGSQTHVSSTWQVAIDNSFSNVLKTSINDTVNKTSWSAAGLSDGLSLYVRVRYKDSDGTDSAWSDAVLFNVAFAVPVAPTISAPANNSIVNQSTVTATSSAFSIQGSVAAHQSTDWQLSTANDFSVITLESLDSTSNKTSWNITGLADGTSYYIRSRYKAANGKVSQWSTAIRINTIFAFVFNTVISSAVNNYNMRSAAIAAGWNQTLPLSMTVTVNSGVVVGSASSSTGAGEFGMNPVSTGTPAFETGSGFPLGSVLNLVNNGSIYGHGGGGGAGHSGATYGAAPGAPGGTGLKADNALRVTNNGTIGGGGGGGGGGGMSTQSTNNNSFYGDGGPGGNGAGAVNGNVYSPTAGQQGGSGTLYRPYGGNGGSLGIGGSSGESGSQGGGGGGAGGSAIIGNGNITWIAAGIRLGGIA